MILIPELKKVVILNPRAGSGSLHRAIRRRYPAAIMLYRHMEAGGVPIGYNNWDKIGVVRHPVVRLWSLYNFLKRLLSGDVSDWRHLHPTVLKELTESISVSFDDYIQFNRVIFPIPNRCMVTGEPSAFYANKLAIPENTKSQFEYLRPDLGTLIYKYENGGLAVMARDLNIELGTENQSNAPKKIPEISRRAKTHLYRVYSWEWNLFGYRW